MDDNVNVFDAKVTIRSTLHTLIYIKKLLSSKGNERRNDIFRSTQFGKWLDFPSHSNDNHLLNYIFQHQLPHEEDDENCPPISYKIGNNTFDFGRQDFCLITGLVFGKITQEDRFSGLTHSPFIERVFPEKAVKRLKRVRPIELLQLTKDHDRWFLLSDIDGVRVCLLIVVCIVFMDRETKNYIADNLVELIERLPVWDSYPWGEYVWRSFYRRNVNVIKKHRANVAAKDQRNKSVETEKTTVQAKRKYETYNLYGFVWALKIYTLEMYTNSKIWWKKDSSVVPRALSWSKNGKFEKANYSTLFSEWVNPIICMVPTSIELIQPWFVCSMVYLGSEYVVQQPLCITDGVEHETVDRVQPPHTDDESVFETNNQHDVVQRLILGTHDCGVELSKESVNGFVCDKDPELVPGTSLPKYTIQQLVAEHEASLKSLNLIQIDPSSAAFLHLDDAKKRLNSIVNFIKKNEETLSEDSVCRHKQVSEMGNCPADGKLPEKYVSHGSPDGIEKIGESGNSSVYAFEGSTTRSFSNQKSPEEFVNKDSFQAGIEKVQDSGVIEKKDDTVPAGVIGESGNSSVSALELSTPISFSPEKFPEEFVTNDSFQSGVEKKQDSGVVENKDDTVPAGVIGESGDSSVYACEVSTTISLSHQKSAEEFFTKDSFQPGIEKKQDSGVLDVFNSPLSNQKFAPSFSNAEMSKLYYTNKEDYPSLSMNQLLQVTVPDPPSCQMEVDTSMDLNLPDFNDVFTSSQMNDNAGFYFDDTNHGSLSDPDIVDEEAENEKGYHTPSKTNVSDVPQSVNDLVGRNLKESPWYLNELNVVNVKEPPSAENVLHELQRKKFKGKALDEPYTALPPTTHSYRMKRALRKRNRKAIKRGKVKQQRLSYEEEEQKGHEDDDVILISPEEWDTTKRNKSQKEKEGRPLTQKQKPQNYLIEFVEDLNRAAYSRKNKVKLPPSIEAVYAMDDKTFHLLPWGNYDILVDRDFWLTLLGVKDKGWLTDKHLDAWFDLMWEFRPKHADWAIASSYFSGFVLREFENPPSFEIPGWFCNGIRYPVMWADVEQVYFSINKPKEHYCLGVLHIRSGVITLYDSLGVPVEETRDWWKNMRDAFKKCIPRYFGEWGVLESKGINPLEYKISFQIGNDVPIQEGAYGDCGVWVCINLYRLIKSMNLSTIDPQRVGVAYREHMFDYFWRFKIGG